VSGRAGGPGAGPRLPRAAAASFIERHGDDVLSTARRYSVSREDAEDAFQRGVEIFLTKAPQIPEDELLPWLKTVVKHEAFAIWRGRDRVQPVEADGLERSASSAPPPDEHVQSYERLAVGAEAIAKLKPQEIRCMLLRADGLSYKQICEATGWTYTKVNRCLTEGRRRFLDRVAGIESGEECDRLAPLLSALADGEATAENMAELRPHLRSCLSCRATLRAFREIPHRAAELVPLAGAEHADRLPGAIARWFDFAVGWVQQRFASAGTKVGAATDAANAGKVAAVAASTIVLAGGAATLEPADDSVASGGGSAGPPAEPLIEGRLSSSEAVPRRPELAVLATVKSAPAADRLEAMLEAAPAPPAPAPDVDAPSSGPVPTVALDSREVGGYGGNPPEVEDMSVPIRYHHVESSEEGYHLDPLVVPWHPPGEHPPSEAAAPEEPAPAEDTVEEPAPPPEAPAP
jgi:RNA polymerase sigma factor (sigma-70 family)